MHGSDYFAVLHGDIVKLFKLDIKHVQRNNISKKLSEIYVGRGIETLPKENNSKIFKSGFELKIITDGDLSISYFFY
jgi:hypothetical protein